MKDKNQRFSLHFGAHEGLMDNIGPQLAQSVLTRGKSHKHVLYDRQFTSIYAFYCEPEYVANFSHRHDYSDSLHYPMPIRVLAQFALRRFCRGLTLFPSGMLCVTNIPSINCNDTYVCSELNGEHAGESCMSLRFIVVEIY